MRDCPTPTISHSIERVRLRAEAARQRRVPYKSYHDQVHPCVIVTPFRLSYGEKMCDLDCPGRALQWLLELSKTKNGVLCKTSLFGIRTPSRDLGSPETRLDCTSHLIKVGRLFLQYGERARRVGSWEDRNRHALTPAAILGTVLPPAAPRRPSQDGMQEAPPPIMAEDEVGQPPSNQ